MLQAIDYKTGKVNWSHKWEGTGGPRSGVLSHRRQSGVRRRSSNNLVALNATTGQPLWHANLGTGMSNGPMTYRARWHAVSGSRRRRHAVRLRDAEFKVERIGYPGFLLRYFKSDPESPSRAV